MSKGVSTTLYKYLLALRQLLCHNAEQLLASSLSFCLRMYICTLSKSKVSEVLHIAQFSRSYPTSVTLLPLSHRRARSKLQCQTLQHLLDVLQAWRHWTCVAREHERLLQYCEELSLRNQVKTPAFTGVPSCGIDIKSRKKVFTRTSGVRNAILLCLRFRCRNNKIIITFLHVRMNQSTKISVFCRKVGVKEGRGGGEAVYELL